MHKNAETGYLHFTVLSVPKCNKLLVGSCLSHEILGVRQYTLLFQSSADFGCVHAHPMKSKEEDLEVLSLMFQNGVMLW